MEGMGLKLTPVVVRCLLSPLSMFGPMAGTSWIHTVASIKLVLTEGITHLQLPTQPPHYTCHS